MNRPHHFYAYGNSEYEISKVILNYDHLGKESLEMYKIEKKKLQFLFPSIPSPTTLRTLLHRSYQFSVQQFVLQQQQIIHVLLNFIFLNMLFHRPMDCS